VEPSTLLTPGPDATRRGRLLVLAICCASIIVVVMDISIVNVALPDIRHDLGASPAGLQWTVDAYTLVLSAFLVLAGSMADRFGRRRVFLVGLTIFGIGSLCCGLAPGIGWLVAARVAQAAGGTMLNPVAMAIVVNTFTDPAERARAIGVFGSMSGLALALGPVLGGVLVDTLGWRSVFFVNVPIVIAAIVAALRFVPESRAARTRRFDPVGQALVAFLLSCVVYVVIEARALSWGLVLTLVVAAVLSLAGIVRYESRRREPLLELRLFRSVPLASAIVMALFALCGFQAFLFVTTLYLQDVRGLSPMAAGLCLLPIGSLVLLLSIVSGRLVAAHGPRRPLLVAGGALAAGGAVLLWLTPGTALPAVIAMYLLIGVFLGLVNPPITNTAVSGMPRSMAGLAAALASSGRQTGTTLGVAVAGAIIGPALGRGGVSFTSTAHSVWWMLVGLGAGLVFLTVMSTGAWADRTAQRAAALFDGI
jgi:EmrB/QacA subfamily drug resistance transporter